MLALQIEQNLEEELKIREDDINIGELGDFVNTDNLNHE